jgi:DNA-binding NtrC family response regulator
MRTQSISSTSSSNARAGGVASPACAPGVADVLERWPAATARGCYPEDRGRSVARDPAQVPEAPDAAERLIGDSEPMRALRSRIRRVAATAATVLVSGETGTGKELVARAVHLLGSRRKGPFVAMNCGAISPSLIESELFGHERGAFTGASRLHHGVFAQADGGTLFLDEVAEMQPDMQVRLLRVLETGAFQRLGGEHAMHADVRIVAATNKVPLAAVRDGVLREDLYYRLQVVPIPVVPLRDRGDDVLLLARHFLATHNRQHGTHRSFTAVALQRLRRHAWPGNVRELLHLVHQGYVMADDDLDALGSVTDRPPERSTHIEIPLGATVAAAERQLVLATLDYCRGSKPAAAATLGISLKTLYCRLNVYHAAPSRVG